MRESESLIVTRSRVGSFPLQEVRGSETKFARALQGVQLLTDEGAASPAAVDWISFDDRTMRAT